MTHPFKTYLKTYRKRVGFTRDEVAFLTGCVSGSHYSRHEHGYQLPQLQRALMYQIIFSTAVCALYAGVFAETHAEVKKRASALWKYLEKQSPSPQRDKKIAILKLIIEADVANGRCRICR